MCDVALGGSLVCDFVPRLVFVWGHMFLLLPTLGGKHSFENRRNNAFFLGRRKLQKRANHLDIIRKVHVMAFSPQRR